MVVNNLLKNYIEYNFRKQYDATRQATGWMEQQLDELLNSVQGRTTYQRLLVAQENFDKIMQRANDWILEGIEKGAASPIITLG